MKSLEIFVQLSETPSALKNRPENLSHLSPCAAIIAFLPLLSVFVLVLHFYFSRLVSGSSPGWPWPHSVVKGEPLTLYRPACLHFLRAYRCSLPLSLPFAQSLSEPSCRSRVFEINSKSSRVESLSRGHTVYPHMVSSVLDT